MKKFAIFDFDGVILESVNVKADAFFELYLPYGKDIAEKARGHHLQNGGMSRFEKFKLYHSNFLSKPLTTEENEILSQKFSKIVLNQILKAPLVVGAQKTLETLKDQLELWVISGTPEQELKFIINERNLSNYFKGIYGAPTSKIEHLQQVIKTMQYDPNDGVFIGDATVDYEAAYSQHMDFVLRETDENKILFQNIKGISKIPNLLNFASVLDTL